VPYYNVSIAGERRPTGPACHPRAGRRHEHHTSISPIQPHPQVLVNTMQQRASGISKEIGERAAELEARRVLGNELGRLRRVASVVLIGLVILALAIYIVYLR
jgi:hypothetical protein